MFKCDLCTFSNIIDVTNENENDEKPIRHHIYKEHLSNRRLRRTSSSQDQMEDGCEQLDDDVVIRSLLDQLVDQIDGSTSSSSFGQFMFRCNQCTTNSMFELKSDLIKHVGEQHAESLTRLKCVYCSKLFETGSVGEYLAHLKTNHKQFIINDLLLNKRKTFGQAKLEPIIDWSRYFDSNSSNVRHETIM